MYSTATEQIADEQKETVKPFRLAKVTELFQDGCPKVRFYGDSTTSQKKYKIVDGTMYNVNDIVITAVIDKSYVILGTINNNPGTADEQGYLTEDSANLLYASLNHTHSGYASSNHQHGSINSLNGSAQLINHAGTSYNLDFSPSNNTTATGADHKWYQIYARTSTISTSDRNAKHDIEDIPTKYEAFYKMLNPKRFKLNKSGYDRYHTGFISQDVEEALQNSKVDSTEFAGFIKQEKEDHEGNSIYEYGLRYEEFIALNTAMIQKLMTKVEELENRVSELERGSNGEKIQDNT